MNRRPYFIVAGVVVAAGLWYLFRPELLFVNKNVSEAFPASNTNSAAASPSQSQSMVLRTGSFHKGAHETKGTATVHQLADGKRVLRFTNFETSNGPDVHVFLVAAADATDNDTVKSAGYIDLGSIKGNIGDQNYDVPANVDLSKYRAVTIWCNRFNVNFGTAPLMTKSDEASVTMNEPMPAQPTSLATGMFHGVAHETKGTATVYQLPDNKRVLRLSNFETSNGPDVRVLLVAATDASDNDTVKNNMPIELGKLKGNIGDQNYELPANVDLNKYKAVTIWCNRFSVNFATAPLSQSKS